MEIQGLKLELIKHVTKSKLTLYISKYFLLLHSILFLLSLSLSLSGSTVLWTLAAFSVS
jgi:hypothetical protein